MTCLMRGLGKNLCQFLSKYWALVFVDPYSHWPEVYYTTITALRKTFSHECVPRALTTDYGNQFTAEEITSWLKGIACRQPLTSPEDPQSEGLVGQSNRNLKCAIKLWRHQSAKIG